MGDFPSFPTCRHRDLDVLEVLRKQRDQGHSPAEKKTVEMNITDVKWVKHCKLEIHRRYNRAINSWQSLL